MHHWTVPFDSRRKQSYTATTSPSGGRRFHEAYFAQHMGVWTHGDTIRFTALETTWRLLRGGETIDALSMNAGVAYDRAETPETGGREAQDPLSELGARGGLGGGRRRRRRAPRGREPARALPALRELYSGALDRFAPNPDLEPEKLLTTEAGVTMRIGRSGELQLVGFHNRLEDAVVRVTLDDGRFIRVNRDELTSTGLEVAGAYRIGPVELTANGTVLWAEVTDAEAGEETRPEHLPDAFGDLDVRFPIYAGVRGGAGIGYTGDQRAIDGVTGGDTVLDAQTLVSGFVSREWPIHASWARVRSRVSRRASRSTTRRTRCCTTRSGCPSRGGGCGSRCGCASARGGSLHDAGGGA